jgi:hypothetical protein
MKKSQLGLLVAMSWLFYNSPTQAEIVVFTIDSVTSQLTLSGNADVGGVGNFLFGTQAAGSLTTRYTGTITADVNSLTNPTSITFQNANIVSQVNGQWIPAVEGGALGPAADGNYGLNATFGVGAIRNLSFNLGSTGVQAVNGAGNFSNASQQWSHSAGTFDIRAADNSVGGTSNMTAIANNIVLNTNATLGSLAVNGPNILLTLPVQLSIPYFVPGTPTVGGNFIYNGTVSGTAVPEPSSLAVLSLLGTGAFLRRKRSIVA